MIVAKQKRVSKAGVILASVFVALNLLDALITSVLLASPDLNAEGNLWMKFNPDVALIVKLALVPLILFAIFKFAKRPDWILARVDIAFAFIVAWNLGWLLAGVR